eukprot:g5538.t1
MTSTGGDESKLAAPLAAQQRVLQTYSGVNEALKQRVRELESEKADLQRRNTDKAKDNAVLSVELQQLQRSRDRHVETVALDLQEREQRVGLLQKNVFKLAEENGDLSAEAAELRKGLEMERNKAESFRGLTARNLATLKLVLREACRVDFDSESFANLAKLPRGLARIDDAPLPTAGEQDGADDGSSTMLRTSTRSSLLRGRIEDCVRFDHEVADVSNILSSDALADEMREESAKRLRPNTPNSTKTAGLDGAVHEILRLREHVRKLEWEVERLEKQRVDAQKEAWSSAANLELLKTQIGFKSAVESRSRELIRDELASREKVLRKELTLEYQRNAHVALQRWKNELADLEVGDRKLESVQVRQADLYRLKEKTVSRHSVAVAAVVNVETKGAQTDAAAAQAVVPPAVVLDVATKAELPPAAQSPVKQERLTVPLMKEDRKEPTEAPTRLPQHAAGGTTSGSSARYDSVGHYSSSSARTSTARGSTAAGRGPLATGDRPTGRGRTLARTDQALQRDYTPAQRGGRVFQKTGKFTGSSTSGVSSSGGTGYQHLRALKASSPKAKAAAGAAQQRPRPVTAGDSPTSQNDFDGAVEWTLDSSEAEPLAGPRRGMQFQVTTPTAERQPRPLSSDRILRRPASHDAHADEFAAAADWTLGSNEVNKPMEQSEEFAPKFAAAADWTLESDEIDAVELMRSSETQSRSTPAGSSSAPANLTNSSQRGVTESSFYSDSFVEVTDVDADTLAFDGDKSSEGDGAASSSVNDRVLGDSSS